MKLSSIFLCLVLALSASFAPNLTFAADKNETTKKKKYSPITAEQFKQFLPGNTIAGEYRQMRERTKTYAFSEKHNADGTTDYTEGPVKSKGLWYTLSRHKICYKYPNDPNMGPQISCFWVYKQDTCYYGYALDAMTLRGPRRFEDWSARWVVKGSGGTCDAPVS